MAKPTVVVTRRIPQAALDILAACCEVDANLDDRAYSSEELVRRARAADALVTVLTDRIGADVIDRLERCRIIANVAVGFDNVDVAAAKHRAIVVTNTPGVLTDATADFAMTLLLAASRRLVEADAFVRAGKYTGWNIMMFLGADLHEKTLGLAGFGRIGQAVAQRALGFGLRLIYADERRAAADVEQRFGARYVDKATLVRESDFLSLHLPLTEETRHYVGAAELAAMKPTAYLVNTSRGPTIDETALVEALRRRTIAGAALDVFEREPALADGLAELDNVVLAPHIASAGRETREKMAEIAARNVVAVLSGSAPLTPV
ncbi:MAG: D-glycerate dehydrogenase [Candidatus Eremiobacteraeota bacterium]|nr:D-glycerate dehydrogenase [Candidatus Eremiobacteraeota bacterium]MBV8353830.1 D-glycerate dehydrogenase [Candidatus Eremiobacteraeota bacterium]